MLQHMREQVAQTLSVFLRCCYVFGSAGFSFEEGTKKTPRSCPWTNFCWILLGIMFEIKECLLCVLLMRILMFIFCIALGSPTASIWKNAGVTLEPFANVVGDDAKLKNATLRESEIPVSGGVAP